MKEYYSRHANILLIMGAVLLAINVAFLLSVPNVPISGLFSAVPLLFMGFALKKTPLVRLGPDSIEVKAGPFSSKRVVALGEIQRVDTSNPRVIVLHTANGLARIPAFGLQEHQRREILSALGQA